MGSTANTDYPVKHPSIPSLMHYGRRGGGGRKVEGGRKAAVRGQEGGQECGSGGRGHNSPVISVCL